MKIISHEDSGAIPRSSKLVFLAAPPSIHYTKQYRQAVLQMEKDYPTHHVLDAATLSKSPQLSQAPYAQSLSGVTQLRILPDEGGFIDKETYDQWLFLHERVTTVDAYLPGGYLVKAPRLTITNITNRRRHAVVLPPSKLQFRASSAYELIAEAGLEHPINWKPMRVDEWTGNLHPIPRIELYQAVVHALQQQEGGKHG